MSEIGASLDFRQQKRSIFQMFGFKKYYSRFYIQNTVSPILRKVSLGNILCLKTEQTKVGISDKLGF